MGKLLLLAVCSKGTIGLVKLQIAFSSELELVLLVTIFGSIGAVGLGVQFFCHKYQCLLVRIKDDRYDIIKFAFSFGLGAGALAELL